MRENELAAVAARSLLGSRIATGGAPLCPALLGRRAGGAERALPAAQPRGTPPNRPAFRSTRPYFIVRRESMRCGAGPGHASAEDNGNVRRKKTAYVRTYERALSEFADIGAASLKVSLRGRFTKKTFDCSDENIFITKIKTHTTLNYDLRVSLSFSLFVIIYCIYLLKNLLILFLYIFFSQYRIQ